ncbi:MAG: ABC transporter permease, partial [Chitinivibrionales bacterium]|nr:ABC transporter permease [Chitinivibrionales bacterium]
AAIFIGSMRLFFPSLPITGALFSIVTAACVAGATMGLCISSLCATVGRAISWLPVIFIPQLMLSGMVIPFDRMPAAGAWLSRATIARPVFSLLKKTAVLEQALSMPGDFLPLFYLWSGLIILLFAGIFLHRRALRE